jgi:phage baseplate assembly protein gpV
MANGFYIGGFLNNEPTCFIELKQNGSIEITASNNVIVKGDVIADGISLKNHTHGGVESGGSNTGKPQ